MKRWTTEEALYLMKNWDTVSMAELINYLDRTEESIIKKARRMSIDTKKDENQKLIRSWTEEEDTYLKENYWKIPNKEIYNQLNRTKNAIIKRANYLGLNKSMKYWTEEEEIYLEEKWGIISLDTISTNLKRSKDAIWLKAWKMGLGEQVTANGKLLSPADVSKILGVNVRTFYSRIWDGKIQCKKFKTGKRRKYQISVKSFCEFIETHQDKWDAQLADLDIIKTYYISFIITETEKLIINDNIPQWLLDKIEKDKKEKLVATSRKDWTTLEELNLLELRKASIPYKSICNSLNRSVESVKTKYHLISKNCING